MHTNRQALLFHPLLLFCTVHSPVGLEHRCSHQLSPRAAAPQVLTLTFFNQVIFKTYSLHTQRAENGAVSCTR